MSAADQAAPQREETLAADPPPDDELVIGIVSAIGIDLQALTAELQSVLSDFGYRSFDLHLTDAFADFPWPTPLIKKPFDERVWSYMDAGDTLCREWERPDAMALLAILQISLAREEETGNIELPSARTAYILRSLKRPEEIETLRAVYGRRFFVIGVATEETARLQYLRDRIRQSRIPPYPRTPKYTAEKLAARDESDPGARHDENDTEAGHGQNVRDTFHRADIFLDLSHDLQSHAPCLRRRARRPRRLTRKRRGGHDARRHSCAALRRARPASWSGDLHARRGAHRHRRQRGAQGPRRTVLGGRHRRCPRR